MISPYCHQCGCTIIIGGRYQDQLAQERGFCSAGCEQVFKMTKQMWMNWAEWRAA